MRHVETLRAAAILGILLASAGVSFISCGPGETTEAPASTGEDPHLAGILPVPAGAVGSVVTTDRTRHTLAGTVDHATILRPPAGSEPRLIIKDPTRDSGLVYQGNDVVHEFEFTNEGPGPLVIAGKEIPCSCTLGALEVNGKEYTMGEPIPPGSKGRIVATLRTVGQEGPKVTDILLRTNDPALPGNDKAEFGVATVSIKAQVERFFIFANNESTLVFPSISNAEEHSGTLTVQSRNGSPFGILSVEPPDSNLAYTFTPVNDTKTAWKITVSVKRGMPLGAFVRRLYIQTDTTAPPAQFSVTGFARGTIAVEPDRGLYLGSVSAAKPVEKNIILRNTGSPAPFTILEISIIKNGTTEALPGIEVTQAERKADGATINESVKELRLRTTDALSRGAFAATIHIKTNIPDGPAELKIPVNGVAR